MVKTELPHRALTTHRLPIISQIKMMRALFISANTEKINMPVLPLGLACVASSTKRAGYDVAMVDLEIERDTSTVIKDALEGFCPEIIGISVRNHVF